jgi:hypothetical protein
MTTPLISDSATLSLSGIPGNSEFCLSSDAEESWNIVDLAEVVSFPEHRLSRAVDPVRLATTQKELATKLGRQGDRFLKKWHVHLGQL